MKARADKCRVDVETIIRMNMDAIAIMGHTTYNLAQRRRDVIRPTINKDYATLCASHVPVTSFLFGDELQTQLTHNRASNKIKNTASAPYTSQKRPYTQSHPPPPPSKIRPTKAFFMKAAATERQKSAQKEIQASTQPTAGSETPQINILT